MKIKLLIVPDKGKQVILTPETKEEENVLKIFDEKNITIFRDCDFEIEECRGGYYRPYEKAKSVVILLEQERLNEKN
jgi:hypothetical protein